MIIGYYQQAFFGAGVYYKLTKKDDETKYKIEYSHSAVPNIPPKLEFFKIKISFTKAKFLRPNILHPSGKIFPPKCHKKNKYSISRNSCK